MAVTPELINWLGIVLGLGKQLHQKVITGQNNLGVGNDCRWLSVLDMHGFEQDSFHAHV